MHQQHQSRPSATPAKSPEPSQSAQSLGEDLDLGGEQLPGSRAPISPRTILQLQRVAGNHAVEQYVVGGLISRAASNEDAEAIRQQNERIRRLNESRAGQIRIGPDGRPMQPSQIPPRPVPKSTGPGGNMVSVESETGSVAQDSLRAGERGAAGVGGGVLEERALLQSRFYDVIRKAGARVQQREIRAKIAAIIMEKGVTMAGREGAVVATSEVPPLGVLVQTVVGIQDILTFGEVVWDIAKILAG